MREVSGFLAMGNRGYEAEAGSAIMDFLFGEGEELMDGLGRGGVAECDVDGEVGTNVVVQVISPCKWTSPILRPD